MSEEILEEIIKQALYQSPGEISFGWQGGEPTLMGLPFFEKAVRLQAYHGKGKLIGNGLQTNGILVDKTWAKFLKEFHFLVGLSLDGPEHIHNRYRVLSAGQGSWSMVVNKAKLLLDAAVAVNSLIVVNNYSVRFPEEIYNFHKNLGLNNMQFIPCVERDPENPLLAAPFSAPPEEYGKFLCKLFDLWFGDFKDGRPTTFIRFFDSLFFLYVDKEPPDCTLQAECGTYLVVEHGGDVYSCDFFVDDAWKLGHIREGRLIHMLNSSRQNKFGLQKAQLPEICKKCRWLKYCRGGCPKDRLRDPRDNGLNHFCQSFKMFFEHAHRRLSALAEKWKQANLAGMKDGNINDSWSPSKE